MPKQISDIQEAGYSGEDDFRSWATKMHWYCQKLERDHGIDFVCQIRGDRTGKLSSAMTGKMLNVSVRSMAENSDKITIERSDAELFFSTTSPMVLAIVRRAPLGQAGQVAIKFVDEQFVTELDIFRRGTAKTHTLHFSEAIADPQEIRDKMEEFLQQDYKSLVQRLLTELRLKDHLQEPHAEILHTAYGKFVFVHSKGPNSHTQVLQRPEIANLQGDIGMPIVFTTDSLLPSQSAGVIGVRGDLFFAREACCHSISQGNAENSGQPLDILKAADQIRDEMAVWNFDCALSVVEELERHLRNHEVAPHLTFPEITFLFARVHVIRAEKKDSKAKDHIEQARGLLSQIDRTSSAASNGDLRADIEALNAAIENIEKGPDAALARLVTATDPYATRIRLAMLLNKQDVDGAAALVEKLSPNERWCELAVTAYILNNRQQEAEQLVKWAAVQKNRSKYPACVVRLADALLTRALASHEKGKHIKPHDLTEKERDDVRAVLEAVKPVLGPIIAIGRVDSELALAAVKIAGMANHLLGNRENISELTNLMYTHRPVPVEVARNVISGYIASPPDLPLRLRKEHPGDLEANILSAVVQTECLGQQEEAFAQAKELISLADTDSKKAELFVLFMQIWQELEGDAASDCERIAASLASGNPKLSTVLEAQKALWAGNADAAIRALDQEEPADNDLYRLQLRANAFIQKRQLADAVDCLLIAAKTTRDPQFLSQTAELAIQINKPEIAAECLELLVEAQPGNLAARNNLACIYTFDLHDIAKAAVQLAALHIGEPANPTHIVNLATCLAQLYRPLESLALYNEACGKSKPDIRAVLGRGELHLKLGKPEAALASLQDFRQQFWDDSRFLFAFMNTAYAAGDEEAAHEAFLALNKLREVGRVEANAFKMVPADEGLEIMKEGLNEARKRNENLHSEMLKGRMPWVWAEQVAGKAIYLGWRGRTYEMAWIGDDPANRANFCIYATNGFHARKSKRDSYELLPLDCPPEGTRVVVDLSALITLHRLGLLSTAADYFGEIVVPSGYLPLVLDDSRKMIPEQRSRQQSAEQLAEKTANGLITITEKQSVQAAGIAQVDEYGEAEEHRYHLIDLLRPVYEAGIINDLEFARISKIHLKKSGEDAAHPMLAQLQDVYVDLFTLETLANFDLLPAVTRYFKVHISREAHTEIRQRLEATQLQEETRRWHFDLWDHLRADSRFRFVTHSVPEEIKERSSDPKDYLPFFGNFIAHVTGAPLLADDRMCQVLTLNTYPDARHAAFGTDTLISALLSAGKMEPLNAAEAICQLMRWRYRFLLPTADILKALAEQYRTYPPGLQLQEIAEYLHDCMRDQGLFGGPEKTANGESMAARFFLSWLNVIAEFLFDIWDDESFPEETAKRLTEWSVREFLPAPPAVLPESMAVHTSSLLPKLLLSRILLQAGMLPKEGRMADAMQELKEALRLSDTEYLRIVTGILDDVRRTEP